MKVELAKSAGFCFGVKRAVDTVYELLEQKQESEEVFTLGPIIHNEQVVSQLEQQGVRAVEEVSNLKSNQHATLVIRSHGVPEQTILELEDAGIRYVDATCPFVKKIHNTVEEYSQKDYEIIIIGNKEHPEVKGILGWTHNEGVVLETEEDARAYQSRFPEKKKCIVAQTTFNYKKFKDLVEIIEKKGYSIYYVNTICNATSVRQKEAEELASRSDAMIVIGGAHSSNSRKLYEICKNQCENTFFIQTVNDLERISLTSFASLGITAGASTPNTIIQEVLEACQKI
ncbi:MAG: 4-hydroxy-3-methylbut-2-enyl diphosphate reductase [Eubacterium sp.]|nr:4-hydroxy-3-methylbut-2-enyl diphosphate reductase [Eubacterium sp.]